MRKTCEKKSTSLGLKPCTWIGWYFLMYRRRSRYHSNGMYGLCPPCMRICTPPSAFVSSILSPICSKESVYPSPCFGRRANAQKPQSATQTFV
jgi:hypothetical protein